ncbi:MAG TPA: nucleotide sugar dehydrogenase [Acidimicrobiales bacterium]|nr:nucleotide sugar dehydrogenase [Acidimicrobiales bacterium]
MRISIFGLGYVGAVSAACLANDGHTVVGVDPNPVKVDMVNRGDAPVIEADLPELMASAVEVGRLGATTSCADAVAATDMAFVCVGTPSQANGNLDFTYLRRVSSEIGEVLRDLDRFFVVVVRSTVLPGTIRDVVIPALETASGKAVGRGFGVCTNPEFLREGTAVFDYYNPPKVVIGECDDRSADLVESVVAQPGAPLVRTPVEVAEMVKYADNCWHAVKIAFANEMGVIGRSHGIDGRELMRIFCTDEKLNISAAYLKPGFAFGGSCLPKDVRALSYDARSRDLDLPLLNAVLPSNERHIDRALQMIMGAGSKKVAVLGLSFKAGTDDLRESPMVEVVERLIGKGYDLRIYDSNVNLAKLVGANRDYILNQIPHISDLMVGSIEDALQHGGTIVIGNDDEEFEKAVTNAREDQVIVDFVRVADLVSDGEGYRGLCW